MSRRGFWLVQRMTSKDSGANGFDGLFALDYMGASEFEWGAIPKSLKEIRSASVGVRSVLINHRDTTRSVYFVGGVDAIEEALPKFEAWLAGGLRGQERSRFEENFLGTADRWTRETNAWWSLQDNVMFALDDTIAERLLRGINGQVAR